MKRELNLNLLIMKCLQNGSLEEKLYEEDRDQRKDRGALAGFGSHL